MTDQNVIEGKLKQAQALVIDAAADATNNTRGHVDGHLKNAEGKIQEAVGHVVDALTDAAHNVEQKLHKH